MSKPSEIQIALNAVIDAINELGKDAGGLRPSDLMAVNDLTTAIKNLKSDNQALRNELEALKASQNKIKADAICDLADNYVNGPITAELTVEYIYEYANKLEAGK